MRALDKSTFFIVYYESRKTKGKENHLKKNKTLSKITLLHYVKLCLRFALFSTVLFTYTDYTVLPAVVWVVFVTEMVLRFFPSRLESPGCQKQFERNYAPTGKSEPINQSWKATATMAMISFLATAGVGALYFTEVIDAAIVMLITLFFSVLDVICILFFCPFQTFVMKNRCCTTCRIYNWDYAMIFSPLVFIPSVYTYTLLGAALLLLLRWEIGYRRHKEYYSPETNAALHCENCSEKLCHHKKQLRSFLKKQKGKFFR